MRIGVRVVVIGVVFGAVARVVPVAVVARLIVAWHALLVMVGAVTCVVRVVRIVVVVVRVVVCAVLLFVAGAVARLVPVAVVAGAVTCVVRVVRIVVGVVRVVVCAVVLFVAGAVARFVPVAVVARAIVTWHALLVVAGAVTCASRIGAVVLALIGSVVVIAVVCVLLFVPVAVAARVGVARHALLVVAGAVICASRIGAVVLALIGIVVVIAVVGVLLLVAGAVARLGPVAGHAVLGALQGRDGGNDQHVAVVFLVAATAVIADLRLRRVCVRTCDAVGADRSDVGPAKPTVVRIVRVVPEPIAAVNRLCQCHGHAPGRPEAAVHHPQSRMRRRTATTQQEHVLCLLYSGPAFESTAGSPSWHRGRCAKPALAPSNTEMREFPVLKLAIGSAETACERRFAALLPPPAVQPQPLLGMLAHPAFDHAGDRLHGALHVDLAFGVAHRCDLVGDLAAEGAAGQADHAGAVDRAFDMAGERRDQRIRHAAAAEECDLDAFDIVLVDQHGDVPVGL